MAKKPTKERTRRVRLRQFLRRGAGTSALGVLIAVYAYTDPFYAPPEVELDIPPAPAGALRAMTLNLAHGRATKFHQNLTRSRHIRSNLEAVAEMIHASQADIVTLQELDGPSVWSGDFDHLEYLRGATDLKHAFHGFHVHRSTPKLAYGTGVLSRFPIVEGESEAFDLNALDTKGYILATIETPEGAVDVISLHLDFKRDGERLVQLDMVSRVLDARASRRPLIVAGDFNTTLEKPESPLHAFLKRHELHTGGHGLPGTYPSHAPYKHIDYLLASAGLGVEAQWVLPTAISDHRAVLVDLRVPRR